MNYGQSLTFEPQVVREIYDIALVENPFSTIRMLYKCPAYGLLAVALHLGAKDIAAGQSYQELGQFWGAVVFALHFLTVIFGGLLAVNWGVSYWNANLFTQWSMLCGTVAIGLYFRSRGAGLEALGNVAGQLLLAVTAALVFEFLAVLWLVRKRDSEPIHRLKEVGRILGLISAVLVAAAFLFFSSAKPEGIVSPTPEVPSGFRVQGR